MIIALSAAVFLLLLVLGLDVGFSMILAAMMGMIINGNVDLATVPLTLVSAIDTEAMATIPLFVLAGEIMNQGGLTRRLITWSLTLVGHFRGALSQAAMATNLVMAGISGSAISDATATGAILIPAMRDDGYKTEYAAAVIAAGAMLGPIIPPAIPMIVYAIMANLSIGRLFLAGVGPGLLLFVGYVVICAVTARRRGYRARERTGWRQRMTETRTAIWALMVPVLIIVGIRSGLMTETEAAGILCAYALLVGMFIYRDLSWAGLGRVFFSAGRMAGVILFLLAAAGPFSWLISEAHIATTIANWVLSLSSHPVAIILAINVMLLVVGMVFEPLPALVIFVPTLIPIQAQLGIDPIHFATVIVVNLMIGMLHPPVGLMVLITSAIGKCNPWKVSLEILPFLAWALVVLVLISVIPALVMWLPNTLMPG